MIGYNDGKSTPGDFQTIQTVTSSDNLTPGTKAGEPFNDPQPADDSKPFYYTDAELPNFTNTAGQDIVFADKPGRDQKLEGNTWQGEMSFVEKGKDGKYQPVVTIKYGFIIVGKMAVNDDIKIVDPSKFQTDSLKKQ